jgi:hypothetical protein
MMAMSWEEESMVDGKDANSVLTPHLLSWFLAVIV